MRLAALLDASGIVVHELSFATEGEPLYEEEAAVVAGASEQRRREFAAGRRCARRALAELGITDFPLLAGPDRVPLWPGAVVGSITHTAVGSGGYCGVAVAHCRLVAGLGIDAEPRLPLPTELWPYVLDLEEKRAALAADEPGVWARLIFSAKEATYKALYPLCRRFLDFPDVRIQLLPRQGRFLAELVGAARSAAPAGALLGKFVADEELLLTGVVLPASGSPLLQAGLLSHQVSCQDRA
jgi:4'-phosphopantetheinyl transferase EntD